MDLKGKTAIVVGATGYIGGEVAKGLHRLGANVVLVGRNKDTLEKMKSELGERVLTWGLVGSLPDQMEEVVRLALSNFGKIDLLLTSTGKWKQVDVTTSIQNFADQLEIDFKAFFEATVIPIMVLNQHFRSVGERGYGLIVDVSSHAAEGFLPGNLTYAPNKKAVGVFLTNLRGENEQTGKDGIKIARIIAQLVDTPENRKSFPQFTEEDWRGAVQVHDMVSWIAHGLESGILPEEQIFESSIVI